MSRTSLCVAALTAGGLLAACQTRVAPGASAPTPTACIDSSRINTAAICTMEYDPVCGCNGRTYANPCVARNAGLLSFRPGPCPNRP